MKISLRIQLEEEVLGDLNLYASRENRPVGEVIQEALIGYFREDRGSIDRSRALLAVLDNPIRLPDHLFRQVVESDYYDQ